MLLNKDYRSCTVKDVWLMIKVIVYDHCISYQNYCMCTSIGLIVCEVSTFFFFQKEYRNLVNTCRSTLKNKFSLNIVVAKGAFLSIWPTYLCPSTCGYVK